MQDLSPAPEGLNQSEHLLQGLMWFPCTLKAEKPCPTAQSRPLINVSKKQIYQTILPAVKQFVQENSLVIQWLRLHAFTAKGPGSVPG